MRVKRSATNDPDPPVDRLGDLLSRLLDLYRQRAARGFDGLPLGPREYDVLVALASAEPISQAQIGRHLGIDRTTMVAVTDRLERHSLVQRGRDPHDRRAYALRLTAEGRLVLCQATGSARKADDAFLAPLSTAQRRELRSLLATLIHHHGAHGIAENWRSADAPES